VALVLVFCHAELVEAQQTICHAELVEANKPKNSQPLTGALPTDRNTKISLFCGMGGNGFRKFFIPRI
jgi:hypothetical protein